MCICVFKGVIHIIKFLREVFREYTEERMHCFSRDLFILWTDSRGKNETKTKNKNRYRSLIKTL